MADHRRRNRASAVDASAYYVNGSAARDPQSIRRPARSEAVVTVAHYEKRKAVLGLGYTLFLTLSICVAIAASFLYVRTNAQLASIKSQVSKKQTELNEKLEKNDSLKESLNTNIDLDELYTKATQELGMVYPGKDQIIYYTSKNSDYVRQYGNIPDGDE